MKPISLSPAGKSILTLACLLHSGLPASAEPADENPVIELTVHAEEGMNVQVVPAAALPLYVNRKAGRVLDTLAAGQVLTVLAMDKFGLQVRGRGRNGPLTGWVGQKKLFAPNPAQLAKIRSFYERELTIRKLVAKKSPTIGMNLAELKRTLGKPSNHMINSSGKDRTEYVIWTTTKEVDLNEALALGTDSDLLKAEVETGRIEVELVDGFAKSINMNAANGANIPTVRTPIVEPFGPAPGKVAAK